MANVLNTDKQISIIAALAEGSSIRSIERMAGWAGMQSPDGFQVGKPSLQTA